MYMCWFSCICHRLLYIIYVVVEQAVCYVSKFLFGRQLATAGL